MTQTATALKPATLVPEARRMAFLPSLFSPALMLIGERAVYQFMSWLAPDDYTGGLWQFHEREGQPLFMSPDADKRFGPAPVSFRSFESNTRHQGDRIWQQYTAMSSSVMQFASRSPVA